MLVDMLVYVMSKNVLHFLISIENSTDNKWNRDPGLINVNRYQSPNASIRATWCPAHRLE